MKVNIKGKTPNGGMICKRLEMDPEGVPLPFTYDEQQKAYEWAEKAGKVMVPASVAAGCLFTSVRAYAQTTGGVGIMEKLMPIVHMLQEFALPVGIGIATWGLIEMMIGNPGGRQKIKYAIGGYVGVFLIPYLFFTLRDALGGIGTP